MLNQQNKIQSFADLLKKFNKTINLISRKDMPNLMIKHVDDAIQSFELASLDKRISFAYPMYDLGSGNGVPGIIWAILSPHLKIYLVDSDERKAEFLKLSIHRLNLNNAEVICDNLYNLQPELKSFFVCRGLMSMSNFFNNKNPFENKRGFFIKGSTWNTEMREFRPKLLESHDYVLKDGTLRSLVFYKPN